MIIDKEKAKYRAAGLDLFRVVAAIMVLLFHCHIHHENSFGPLTGFHDGVLYAFGLCAVFDVQGQVACAGSRTQEILPETHFRDFSFVLDRGGIVCCNLGTGIGVSESGVVAG